MTDMDFKQEEINMFCENCGAKLKEDDRFCPECGTPVKVPSDAGQEQQPYRQPEQSQQFYQQEYREPEPQRREEIRRRSRLTAH